MPDDSGPHNDNVPHIDKARVQVLGETLKGRAQAILDGAGGVNHDVPEVPYDWFDLRQLIVRLDRAREGYDRRLANAIADVGGWAIEQRDGAEASDHFDLSFGPPLPAGRGGGGTSGPAPDRR